MNFDLNNCLLQRVVCASERVRILERAVQAVERGSPEVCSGFSVLSMVDRPVTCVI